MKTAPVLTLRREAIVVALRGSPGLSTRQVADAIGIDAATADYHLRRLRQAGVVIRRRYGRCLAHFLSGVSP